jgi:hypothetical protein
MKKPWQPEELIAAVRQAAEEYDRLDSLAQEREQLAAEVSALTHRVTALESEVQRLHAYALNTPRSAAPSG